MEPELDLVSAILDVAARALETVWTHVPARVSAVQGDGRVSCTPTVHQPTGEALPDVIGVRVVQPMAGGVGLLLPVAKGTPGMLLCCALDPAAWLLRGAETAPRTGERHGLAFAVFLPGVGPTGYEPDTVPVLGDISHLGRHPMALGDGVSDVLEFLHQQITTCVPSPQETGLAAIKTAWASRFPVLPALTTSDAKVTK